MVHLGFIEALSAGRSEQVSLYVPLLKKLFEDVYGICSRVRDEF